jgi:uncharacterized protein (TIGR03545 family)
MKLFRWKAIVPMTLLVVIVVLCWLFYVDRAIRLAIEYVGTEIVGAKVELASARLRLRHADLVLQGLQVTNPDAPMTNLFEIPEIVADLNGRALLDKKVVIETLAVRGMRFGTPRRTSGAIEKQSETTGLVTRRVLDWAGGIPIPTLDLEGLAGTVVRVDAINADSLASLRQARAVVAATDSLRRAWESDLRALDPAPTLDSARALATRLAAMDLRRTSPTEIAAAVAAARSITGRVTTTRDGLTRLKAGVDSGIGTVRRGVSQLDEARQADYAYARGLLNLPSFAAPDLSMAIFGQMALARVQPVLRWVNLVEAYIPPGMKPKQKEGPERLRMAGTTYVFPKERTWPAFLLEHADADLAIGGRTVATGSYWARVNGATTEPAVYGRPLTFGAGRAEGVGLRDFRVGGMIDRVGRIPRDSLDALVGGVSLPVLPIPKAQAQLDFGESVLELAVARDGPLVQGVLRVHSPAASWSRSGADSAAAGPAPRIGTTAWAEALLWRGLSSVTDVRMEARFEGELARPRFTVSSNVGDAIAASIRGEIGAEIERAEREVRAQVDRLVNEQIGRARAQATALQTQIADRLGLQTEQLAQVNTELEQQVSRLTQGVRLPGGVRLPRP